MNKRDFLKGCAATLVGVAAAGSGLIEAPKIGLYGRSPLMDVLPDLTNAQLWYSQWAKDAMPVYSEAMSDTILFGIGGIEQTEEYPYVKAIDPKTMVYTPDPRRQAEKIELLGV